MIVEKEKKFISAVIYIHNNEKDIATFVNLLYHKLNEDFLKFEIICVNDASTDNSCDILKNIAVGFESGVISIVNMSFYQGLELSMNAGVDLSIGDFVLEFDTVSALVPLEKIMQVYIKCLQGFDIVSVSPSTVSRHSSKLFYTVFNMYSNKNYALKTEAFRIISRRAINRCQAMSKTIPYRKAVYADCGLKSANIEDESLNSFISINDSYKVDTAIDALVLFTNAAAKMNLYLTVLFILVCVAVMGYVVYSYALGNPVSGWTTSTFFMSFGFLSVFIILGIILKYLTVIIGLIFKKKTYITESVEKLTK